MAVSLNLTSNGYFVPAGGYPLALGPSMDYIAIGVLPKGFASVSATLKAVAGVVPSGVAGTAATTNAVTACNVHLGLFAAPTSSGGVDGAPVVQTDLDNCLRHRDPSTYDANDAYYATDDFRAKTAVVRGSIPLGLPVADAVETIITEMEKGTFYILTHPAYNPAITGRVAGIVAGVRPGLVQR